MCSSFIRPLLTQTSTTVRRPTRALRWPSFVTPLLLNPPLSTRLGSNNNKLLFFFSSSFTNPGKTAYTPTAIAEEIFKSIGNYTIVREQGYFSVLLRLMLKVIDYNLLSLLTSLFSHTASEYKKLMQERKARQQAK